VRSEGVVLIWDGSDWVGSGIDASALQNLDSVGINTTADATNRLAVSSDATLLSHAGSDHRVVVNKDGETDTASFLFQTGYSGRAEMGTAGSDDFAVKAAPMLRRGTPACPLMRQRDGRISHLARRCPTGLILAVAGIVIPTIGG
jgi:hypothetical protein